MRVRGASGVAGALFGMALLVLLGPAVSAGEAAVPSAPRSVQAATVAASVTVTWQPPAIGSASSYDVGCASTDGGSPLTGSAAGSTTSVALDG